VAVDAAARSVVLPGGCHGRPRFLTARFWEERYSAAASGRSDPVARMTAERMAEETARCDGWTAEPTSAPGRRWRGL